MSGRSVTSAIRLKCSTAISGRWPKVYTPEGNTSRAEAPPSCAIFAMRAASRPPSAYTPLEDRRLIPDLTAEEDVLVPAWAAHVADAEARLEKVYGLIPALREFAPRKGSQLSGGQQKLVALGR